MSDILDNPSEENIAHLKERHGCVTAWLVLMIVGGAMTVFTYFFFADAIVANLPTRPSTSLLWGMGILGLINVIFAILIFQWKKLGFMGIIGTTVIAFGLNMVMGLGILQSLSGLLGIVILYGILQIKNKNGRSAWSLLE